MPQSGNSEANGPKQEWPPKGLRYYYADAHSVIIHGDCREILPQLPMVDLVLTDPPYGIGADKNLRAGTQHGKAAAQSRDYGAGNWDCEPPPRWLFDVAREKSKWQIIWGGNYFELPPSACWLVWDKDNSENGYADCELAWTNLKKAVWKLRFRWMGMLQENMSEKEPRFHPTQKPVLVMAWAIGHTTDCQTILDPYMGSGTTLVAAKMRGIKAIGIELEEKYCEIAVERLRQEILIPA